MAIDQAPQREHAHRILVTPDGASAAVRANLKQQYEATRTMLESVCQKALIARKRVSETKQRYVNTGNRVPPKEFAAAQAEVVGLQMQINNLQGKMGSLKSRIQHHAAGDRGLCHWFMDIAKVMLPVETFNTIKEVAYQKMRESNVSENGGQAHTPPPVDAGGGD
jgi:hypothetical protein